MTRTSFIIGQQVITLQNLGHFLWKSSRIDSKIKVFLKNMVDRNNLKRAAILMHFESYRHHALN